MHQCLYPTKRALNKTFWRQFSLPKFAIWCWGVETDSKAISNKYTRVKNQKLLEKGLIINEYNIVSCYIIALTMKFLKRWVRCEIVFMISRMNFLVTFAWKNWHINTRIIIDIAQQNLINSLMYISFLPFKKVNIQIKTK